MYRSPCRIWLGHSICSWWLRYIKDISVRRNIYKLPLEYPHKNTLVSKLPLETPRNIHKQKVLYSKSLLIFVDLNKTEKLGFVLVSWVSRATAHDLSRRDKKWKKWTFYESAVNGVAGLIRSREKQRGYL